LGGSASSVGDYAFDAGIITVSFEREGQGFLVSRHSILKKNISQDKIQQKVYQDTTFGGCGSFYSRVILPVKERSKGEGGRKTQVTIEAGAYLHQRHNR
jgi:hypothetical protein